MDQPLYWLLTPINNETRLYCCLILASSIAEISSSVVQPVFAIIQTFESELQELIEIAVSFSKKGSSNVIVLSIPDWSAFPFAEGRDINKITGEIDDFNAIVKRTAQENEVLFFDITDISRLASEQPELIAEDLLHPSGEMYRLWVEKIINNKEFQEIDF